MELESTVALNYLQTLAANVENADMTDKDFREFVNCSISGAIRRSGEQIAIHHERHTKLNEMMRGLGKTTSVMVYEVHGMF